MDKQVADLVSTEEVKITINEDDFFDVKINNKLLIHIKRNDVGYSVDVYKDNKDPEEMEDSGFIDSITVWDDTLQEDKEE